MFTEGGSGLSAAFRTTLGDGLSGHEEPCCSLLVEGIREEVDSFAFEKMSYLAELIVLLFFWE